MLSSSRGGSRAGTPIRDTVDVPGLDRERRNAFTGPLGGVVDSAGSAVATRVASGREAAVSSVPTLSVIDHSGSGEGSVRRAKNKAP